MKFAVKEETVKEELTIKEEKYDADELPFINRPGPEITGSFQEGVLEGENCLSVGEASIGLKSYFLLHFMAWI